MVVLPRVNRVSFGAGLEYGSPPAGAKGDACKDERDSDDMEEPNALAQKHPREQATEDRHEMQEDARDVGADLSHRAIPEDVAHERGKNPHVEHRRHRGGSETHLPAQK